MLNQKRRQKVLALCRKLIGIPSVTGDEKVIASFVSEEMLALGFDQVWIDQVGNVVGKIKGTGEGPRVLFDGHLDTVEVSDPSAWTRSPFGAEIVDNCIFGRGAADMKGALAAMISGIAFLAEDERPKGDIYVSGTILEEIAEGFSLSYILGDLRPDVVVIGEATELNINIGQRGRAEIVLETKGIPVHSSNSKAGINAVESMLSLLGGIKQISLPQHAILGSAALELTDIISSPYPGASVIPEKCRVTFDRRLMVDEVKEHVLEDIRRIINKETETNNKISATVDVASLQIKSYTGLEVEHSKFAPAWLLSEDHEIVNRAKMALKSMGMNPKINVYSFCTNGSVSAGIYNIPTIGFGPCKESQAHIIDEFIQIDHLIQATEGYYQLGKYLSA
ncbi:MAG: YgeY family selenium metabolism-linked hydrolase [Dethiobacter sp.]|jgi:putative selenium metabolism hydrolase|nr:YgeY family selenium metabolism-linked hydrolase [Dethiobacter sp.]